MAGETITVSQLNNRTIVNIGDANELVCPNCDSSYTRHHDVEIYVRERGDDSSGIRNPSSRQNGIRISISCEDCGFVGSLSLYCLEKWND